MSSLQSNALSGGSSEEELMSDKKAFYLGPPHEDYESLMVDLLPGANVLVVSDALSYHRVCCEVEDAGFELRDCIAVLTPSEPILVTVAMKHLDGTFVENALKHGVAGYNIDGARITVDAEDPNRRPNRNEESDFDDAGRVALNGALTKNTVQDEGAHHSKGRFPANLILMHHPDCQCVGTKRVKPSNGSGRAYEGGGDHENDVYGTGLKYRSGVFGVVGEDGTEEVDDWQCIDGCPVKALDQQTADVVHGAGHARDGLDADMKPDEWNAVTYSGGWKAAKTVHRFGDVGGASRFFKQVVDEDALFEYLRVLVAPPTNAEDEHGQDDEV